jgi:hypothetical protein
MSSRTLIVASPHSGPNFEVLGAIARRDLPDLARALKRGNVSPLSEVGKGYTYLDHAKSNSNSEITWFMIDRIRRESPDMIATITKPSLTAFDFGIMAGIARDDLNEVKAALYKGASPLTLFHYNQNAIEYAANKYRAKISEFLQSYAESYNNRSLLK